MSGRPRSRMTRSGASASSSNAALGIWCIDRLIALRAQARLQQFADGRLVVHDQHFDRGRVHAAVPSWPARFGTGKAIVKTAPSHPRGWPPSKFRASLLRSHALSPSRGPCQPEPDPLSAPDGISRRCARPHPRGTPLALIRHLQLHDVILAAMLRPARWCSAARISQHCRED